MPLTTFSADVGDALVRAFPQFEDFVVVGDDTLHLEIRYPHPTAKIELMITTASEEITVFLGHTHRHIGMCQKWPVERQIAEAKAFIAGILSGTVALARSSKYPGLWVDEARTRGDHCEPDEQVTHTTWDKLQS